MNRNTEGVGLPHPRTPYHAWHRRRATHSAANGSLGESIGASCSGISVPSRQDASDADAVAARGAHYGCQAPLFWSAESEIPGSAPLTIGICTRASDGEQATDSLASLLLDDILRTIRRTVDTEERDWRVLHSFPRNGKALSQAILHGAEQHLLSALVVEPGLAAEHAAHASLSGVPALALLHDGAGLPRRWGAVSTCLRRPLELAAGHLRALGHQRIALLSGGGGINRALRDSWDTLYPGPTSLPWLQDEGRLTASWRAGSGPDAVICGDPAIAHAVAAAATEADIAQPIPVVVLRGQEAYRLPVSGVRVEAVVAIDAAPVGEAVIRWLDDLLGCSCLCCAGAMPCERHLVGIRLRVPLSARRGARGQRHGEKARAPIEEARAFLHYPKIPSMRRPQPPSRVGSPLTAPPPCSRR